MTTQMTISKNAQSTSAKRSLAKRAGTVAAMLMAAVTLGACVTNGQGGYGQKQGWGTVLGAGTGALVGSQLGSGRGKLAMVAIGALAGSMIGSEVGASLDRADQAYHARTQNAALNSADWQTVSWSNPDTGHGGSVTPVRTMRQGNYGPVCREYRTTITVGGRVEEGYGTACREADGSWRLQS
ncbi:MAG: RT0821/Lpp0805 family surface protein [Rhodospirillaceae bacterium]